MTRKFFLVFVMIFLIGSVSAILGGTPSSSEMASLFEKNPDKAWEEFDREEHMNERVLNAALENDPERATDFLNGSLKKDQSLYDFNLTNSFESVIKENTSLVNDYPKLRKDWFQKKYNITDNSQGFNFFNNNGIVKTKGAGSTEFNLSKEIFQGANITESGEVILKDGTRISSSKVSQEGDKTFFEGGSVNVSSSDLTNIEIRDGSIVKDGQLYRSSKGTVSLESKGNGYKVSGNNVRIRSIDFDESSGTSVLGSTEASFSGKMTFDGEKTIIGENTRYSPYEDGERAIDFNVENRSLYTSKKEDCDQVGFSCIFRKGSNVSVDPTENNKIEVENLVQDVSKKEREINDVSLSMSSNENYFKEGDSGKEVRKIQRIVGMSEDEIDGVYDKETAQAVRDWQKENNIKVDGLFGTEAKKTAFGEYNLGTIYEKGSRGAKVKDLQKFLMSEGYDLPEDGADGIYGSETIDALKEWQKDRNIPDSGKFGEESLNEASLISQERSQYSLVSGGKDYSIDDFSVENIEDDSSVIFNEGDRKARFSEDFPEFKGNYKNFKSNLKSGFTSSAGEDHTIKVTNGVLEYCSHCQEFGSGKFLDSEVKEFKKNHGKEFFDKMKKKYGEQIRKQWLTRFTAPKNFAYGNPYEAAISASKKIKSSTGQDISPAFLHAGALSEGANKWINDRIGESKTERNSRVSGFQTMGLDTFGDRANFLKRKGYLPKDFKIIEDYSPTPATNEEGKTVMSATFPNYEDAMTAMAAEYAYRRDAFERDVRDLGMNPSEFSKDEIRFWTYTYYNTGSGTARDMLESYRRKGWLENEDYLWRNENPDKSWSYQTKAHETRGGPQVYNNRRISNFKMIRESLSVPYSL